MDSRESSKDALLKLKQWEEAFPSIINERRRDDLRAGLTYMVEMTRSGYSGFCSPLMLSSYAEQLACEGDLEYFNWFRVSALDPRIRGSEWLKPENDGGPHDTGEQMPPTAEGSTRTVATDSAETSRTNASGKELKDQDFPHYRPGTVEYNRNIRIRPQKCDRCERQCIVCLAHMGFAPCVPCKPVGGGCNTAGENAISYHSRVFRSEESGDFANRKLKPAVRRKYEDLLSAEAPQAQVIEGAVTNKKLWGQLLWVIKEVGSLRQEMGSIRRDTRQIIAELLRVTRGGHTTIAPPTDEPAAFPAQPAIYPIDESSSIESTSNLDGHDSTYLAAPASNTWMQQPALATLMEESLWTQTPSYSGYSTHLHQIPATPEVGTPVPDNPHPHARDAMYPYSQDDARHQSYGEGSLSALSGHSMGE